MDVDYCRHCHRLTRHIEGTATGLLFCERCGKPQPPPMDRREAIETIKRICGQWMMPPTEYSYGIEGEKVIS